MTSAFFPPSETAEQIGVLDDAARLGIEVTEDFEAVLTAALQIVGCRVGIIDLAKGGRQWVKVEVDLTHLEVPRCISLANHTMAQSEPAIIEDLTLDPRFRDSLVLAWGIRFYAGVALRGDDGVTVGALCVMDAEPRAATRDIADILRRLGRVVEGLLRSEARATTALALAKTAELRQQKIREKACMFEQAVRLAKIGSWQFDVASRLFTLSDEAYRIHEIEIGTVLHIDDMHARFPLSDLDLVAARYKNAEATGEGYEILGELITAKGTRRWAHRVVEIEERNGKVVRLFSVIRDFTAEHDTEQALWRAAHYDALTEAPNRHYWTMRLNQAFARAKADDDGLTILMFDLDGFKEINDTRGHAVGDDVLCEVARRLAETLPEGAFHARLGGDEFAVLLEGSLPAVVITAIVRSLLTAIQTPIIIGELRLQISGTFGSASFPADAATASDLMQRADIALYQAKRSHRSSFVSFRREIGDLFNDKRHAIELVAAAIEQKRLVPFYQPKIDLKTGAPTGFEALCRIEAADGTILGPSQFLPALNDPASSARIGAAMLDLVTADIAMWRAAGLAPGRIALNVASSDFAAGDLDRRVLARLVDLELPASALEIEVTENIILGKEAVVVGAALQAMNDAGIIIALDDFGTGYASLTHLRDAPIQYLKLDQSFIAGLGRGADSAIIVRSIVDLGHSLGMKIVAEGIETAGQSEFLRAIGCDEAQGFLFGRPVSRAATLKILEGRRRHDVRVRAPFLARYISGAARRSAIESLAAGLHRKS